MDTRKKMNLRQTDPEYTHYPIALNDALGIMMVPVFNVD